MMPFPLNRKQRKAMAASVKRVAMEAARSSLDYDQHGNLVRVTDHRALAVLTRAYERMLAAGGEPQLLRLTDEAAAAFPRGGNKPTSTATPWLAVGLDPSQAATYYLDWIDAPAMGAMAQRAIAEFAMFAKLAMQCGRAGFPVAGHA